MKRLSGICGRMGSGKSSLAKALAGGGACHVIELDDLRRHALWVSLEPRHVSLRMALGARLDLDVEGPGAFLRRPELEKAVFGTLGGMAAFRGVSTPVLRTDVLSAMHPRLPSVLVWTMLAEDGYGGMLDGPLIVVTCAETVALGRLAAQSGDPLSYDDARRRLRMQPGDAERVMSARAACTDTLVVDGNEEPSTPVLDLVRGRMGLGGGMHP